MHLHLNKLPPNNPIWISYKRLPATELLNISLLLSAWNFALLKTVQTCLAALWVVALPPFFHSTRQLAHSYSIQTHSPSRSVHLTSLQKARPLIQCLLAQGLGSTYRPWCSMLRVAKAFILEITVSFPDVQFSRGWGSLKQIVDIIETILDMWLSSSQLASLVGVQVVYANAFKGATTDEQTLLLKSSEALTGSFQHPTNH